MRGRVITVGLALIAALFLIGGVNNTIHAIHGEQYVHTDVTETPKCNGKPLDADHYCLNEKTGKKIYYRPREEKHETKSYSYVEGALGLAIGAGLGTWAFVRFRKGW